MGRARRWLVGLGGVLAVLGCAPEHDWREVQVAPQPVAVLLPGRPAVLTRTVELAGYTLALTMYGAQAGGAMFTVAAGCLPLDQRAHAAAVAAAMRAQMVRNLHGVEQAAHAVAVAGTLRGGVAGVTYEGTEVVATGQVQGQPARLVARFVAAQRCVAQAVVLGPDPEPEVAAFFLASLRIQP